MKNSKFFLLEKIDDSYVLTLLNEWNKATLPLIINDLENLKFLKNEKLIIDFGKLLQCDSCSIIYLISFFKDFKKENCSLKNFHEYEKTYKFYEKHYQEKSLEKNSNDSIVENVGKTTYELLQAFKNF